MENGIIKWWLLAQVFLIEFLNFSSVLFVNCSHGCHQSVLLERKSAASKKGWETLSYRDDYFVSTLPDFISSFFSQLKRGKNLLKPENKPLLQILTKLIAQICETHKTIQFQHLGTIKIHLLTNPNETFPHFRQKILFFVKK